VSFFGLPTKETRFWLISTPKRPFRQALSLNYRQGVFRALSPDSFFALSVVLPGVLGLQVPPDDNPAVWVNAAYAFNATGGEILCEASGSLNTGSGATVTDPIACSWGVVVGTQDGRLIFVDRRDGRAH
jgi:hypothetical protein